MIYYDYNVIIYDVEILKYYYYYLIKKLKYNKISCEKIKKNILVLVLIYYNKKHN